MMYIYLYKKNEILNNYYIQIIRFIFEKINNWKFVLSIFFYNWIYILKKQF